MKTDTGKLLLAALALGSCIAAPGAVAAKPESPPEEVRMTWYGITNWHYQIGNVGVILDGESVNGRLTPASVTKQLSAIRLKGTVDYILAGHVHPDHTNQMPELARQTTATIYGPQALCTTLKNQGIPADRCVPVFGGETIQLGTYAKVRVVRWVHSVDCGELSNGVGGPETFGYLFTVDKNHGMNIGNAAAAARNNNTLNWYVSDSGAGGEDLFIPRVAGGKTYGSPMENLAAAMADAGLTRLDIWQGGPESRMVNQAKFVVPAFNVQIFMPHHLDARANAQSSFRLEYGMHYAYLPEDQPKLQALLESRGVPQVYPTNYWDAWVYDKHGLRPVENTEMKAIYGIPPTGPGPGVQGPNPRKGELECPTD
jgi:hypothetical protein